MRPRACSPCFAEPHLKLSKGNNSQRQTDLDADRKIRRYAFRIFDKGTRSAICLFAHILGKVKYLLALLALPHTSRDTLSGVKR